MDPISVSALVALLSKMFSGTGDRVGEQLWDSLGSVVRRLFGRRSTSVEAVKRLGERPGDEDAIRSLARALVTDSARDPQAAAQLRHWVAAAEVRIAEVQHGSNIVHGDVSGSSIQSHQIHGNIDITF